MLTDHIFLESSNFVYLGHVKTVKTLEDWRNLTRSTCDEMMLQLCLFRSCTFNSEDFVLKFKQHLIFNDKQVFYLHWQQLVLIRLLNIEHGS